MHAMQTLRGMKEKKEKHSYMNLYFQIGNLLIHKSNNHTSKKLPAQKSKATIT